MIFRNVWFLSRFGIESLQKHDRCMTNKKAKVKITDQIKDAIRNEYVQGVELDTGERTMFTLDELIAKQCFFYHHLQIVCKRRMENAERRI